MAFGSSESVSLGPLLRSLSLSLSFFFGLFSLVFFSIFLRRSLALFLFYYILNVPFIVLTTFILVSIWFIFLLYYIFIFTMYY